MLSKRSRFATNPIREEDAEAAILRKKGKEIIKLNTGDPPAYFPTPKYIIDAYIKALKEGKTGYSRSEGIDELVAVVQKRYKSMYNLDIGYDDVITTQGISEGIFFLNSALIDDNDYAIVFRPYFPAYISNLYMNGGNAIFDNYDEERHWNINPDALRNTIRQVKKTKKGRHIKYIIIANPCNPTGSVLDKNILEEIVDISNDNDILIISDEIYDEIIYNGAKFTSISEIAKGIPYVLLNGASKDYDATGFRIGFMIVPGTDRTSIKLKEKFAEYARMRLSVNTPSQYATAEAMGNLKEHSKSIESMVNEIAKRVNFAVDRLEENPYIEVVRPRGAFYIFPRIKFNELRIKDDSEFVKRMLLDYGVQITRGSGFGSPGHIRLVGLAPKEILGYAIDKINTLCRSKAKHH